VTRALIVDDNADNLYFLRVLLQGHGYAVEEARHGEEALIKAREHPPDLTVSDLLMPVMDGYTLLREWRADERLQGVPFIVYTATYTDPTDERLALDLGADAFMLKPSEPEPFIACIREVLARGHAAQLGEDAVDERGLYEGHSATLIRKLEKKARLLDEANRELRAEIAERKQTEGALRQSEARYRNLFHSIADPLFVYDQETLAILDANRAAEVHYGHALATFLAMTMKDLEVEGATNENVRRVAHGGVAARHRKADGTVIDVEVQASEVDFAGRTGSVAQVRDVTERKRAEAEVARTTTLLEAVANGTPDAVFVKDRQGKYLLVNRAAAQFSGRSVHEVLGRDDRQLLNPDDARNVAEQDRLVMESGEAHSFEATVVVGGLTRAFHATKVPYRDARGNVIGVIGISRDVSERVRSEAALLLRDRAIQAVSQGILITDASRPENPIVYASPGFTRMTQYEADEVLGKTCSFLQGKDTDEDAVAELRAAIAQGRGCSVELINYRKDGTPFWNQVALSPVFASDEKITHFVGVQTDVTERHRLESQFRQAQKMEAIGRLAGGVAHDFNNLLTVINAYSSLLIEQLDPDDAMAEPLSQIRSAGERASSLTHQLLAFSRQQVLESSYLSVSALVRDTESMLRRLIGEDVILVTTLGAEADWVKADPHQLVQVLLNLAVNARDAMPTGGRITIETQSIRLDDVYCRSIEELSPGDYVLLSFSDTGCGMNEEVQSRAFEPFFTTKDVGKGTGLGLPTVHGIVRQSRGHVSVYSEVGLGTTFKVYLPCVSPPDVNVKPVSVPLEMPVGHETILLVEDEGAVRDLAASILRGCGFRVLEAASGAEALRICEEEPWTIDLLVSDVVMPNMSGRILAERLLAARPACRVLLLSGYTSDAVVRHGVLEAEFNFLQKPFTALSLARKIRNVLDA